MVPSVIGATISSSWVPIGISVLCSPSPLMPGSWKAISTPSVSMNSWAATRSWRATRAIWRSLSMVGLYFPLKFGVRFSTKARKASPQSSEAMIVPWSFVSMAMNSPKPIDSAAT